MKQEIKVPAMGESINEATVGEIFKATGTAVGADDEILELETDKVNQVLYAPSKGTLTLSVATDDTVQIGQVIGFVDTEGAPAATSPKEEVPPPPPPASAPPEPKSEPPPPPAAPSGHEARVTKEAFLKEEPQVPPPPPPPAAAAVPAAPPPVQGERRETRTRMSRIRKVIASRLVEAQQTTAMLTTFNEVDMSAVMQLRSRYKDPFAEIHGCKLGFMSFFVKAVVSALQATPGLNSSIDGDEIVHREYYDIGIAVGTERGLVVPVVRDCAQLSFAEVEQAIVNYAVKAREGKLVVDDLQGGSFTITNGGVYGSLLSTPILNAPQSGILGMHKIEKRAVVVGDEVVVRPMMYLALSYDHRVVDGKEAVTFLVHIKNMLEDPSRMLLEV